MNKIFYIAIALFASFQVGAKSVLDYSYLVTHPTTLEKEYERCQHVSDPNCNVVKLAIGYFVQLVNERRDDPQGFGKLTLASQLQLSNAEILFKETALDSPNYAAAKQDFENQQQKVNTLMAVIESTSM